MVFRLLHQVIFAKPLDLEKGRSLSSLGFPPGYVPGVCHNALCAQVKRQFSRVGQLLKKIWVIVQLYKFLYIVFKSTLNSNILRPKFQYLKM